MTAITHEYFCTPRPGETEPRIERYRLDQFGADGITVINRPLCHRCIECGAQVFEGALPTAPRAAQGAAFHPAPTSPQLG